jgi:hypothetical protein
MKGRWIACLPQANAHAMIPPTRRRDEVNLDEMERISI